MTRFTLKSLFTIVILSLILIISVLVSTSVSAQDPPEINWIEGPTVVDLGDAAEIQLGENYLFLNAEDTKEIMEYAGEPISGLEVGCVLDKAEDQYWQILFSYDQIGYVSDDEQESLDPDAILNSIVDATEEANKQRIKQGFSAIEVIGWYEEPHYDVDSHNLVWAVLGKDLGTQEQLVNYNTRLLGRHGYMAVVFVEEPAKLASNKPKLDDVVAHFSWKSGKSYAEWVSGDKVAEIGLTALIAGGAGAVLAKTGLLGKIWYFLVAGAAAIGGAIWKLIKRATGQR